MAGFSLSKWYLDCVSDSGDVSLLYTGWVQWGAFHMHYSSVLESARGIITTRDTFHASQEPSIMGDSLVWKCKPLQVDGQWKSDSTELRSTVFSTKAGSTEWHCLMPRARARIGQCEGLGYAEHLAMTIAPWKLPLRMLRWGRFLSGPDWVVWIDWYGDYSRTLVYRNGRRAQPLSIGDAQIDFEDGSRLIMDRSLVIRQGPLGSTALSAIPGVRDSMPGRLLQLVECKWRSRARIVQPQGPEIEGWAIHEKVEWPE